MPEEYVGVKFKTKFLEKRISSNDKNEELISWCKKFHKLGLMPDYEKGSSGNLSFRTGKGFIITGTSTFSEEISEKDLVEVVKVDAENNQLSVVGLTEPSSESLVHWIIYKYRPEIQAIFHGHSDQILERLTDLVSTTKKEIPYGTKKTALAVKEILAKNNFIIIRNHGFVCIGKDFVQIDEKIDEILKKCFS